MLTVLAEDDSEAVQEAVSWNNSTSAEILAVLAEDPGRYVRMRVAQNCSTDPNVLTALSYDANERVSCIASQNPSLPLTRILELAELKDWFRRRNVVHNLSLLYDNLLLMVSDEDKDVRHGEKGALVERNEYFIVELRKEVVPL